MAKNLNKWGEPQPAAGLGRNGWPKVTRELRGRRVVALRPLSNSLGSVPAGTEMVVTGWKRGMDLEMAQACAVCGMKFRVSGVLLDAVRLVPVDAGVTDARG